MIIPGILASSKSGHLWAPGQDYVSISTAIVDSVGAASITFSSIPSTFTHLQIRGIARCSGSGGNNIFLEFNASGSTGYYWHYLSGDGATATAGSSSSYLLAGYAAGSGASAGIFGASIIDILDYTSVNKNKTVRTLTGADVNGSGYVLLESGVWLTSSTAINSIKITTGGGNFSQYSQFSLYGVK